MTGIFLLCHISSVSKIAIARPNIAMDITHWLMRCLRRSSLCSSSLWTNKSYKCYSIFYSCRPQWRATRGATVTYVQTCSMLSFSCFAICLTNFLQHACALRGLDPKLQQPEKFITSLNDIHWCCALHWCCPLRRSASCAADKFSTANTITSDYIPAVEGDICYANPRCLERGHYDTAKTLTSSEKVTGHDRGDKTRNRLWCTGQEDMTKRYTSSCQSKTAAHDVPA